MSLGGRIGISAFALGLGCASAPTPAGTPAPPPAVSTAQTATPPPARVAAPDLPAPLGELADVACALLSPKWPTESFEDPAKGRRSLRFRPESAPYADVYRGTHVELALPTGDARQGGMLSLDADGVVLRGVLAADEMPLYPAGAFVVSDVFVPDSERRLVLRSARSGLLTVAVPPVAKVRVGAGDLAGERPCSDVSLGPVVFDADAIDRAIGAPARMADGPATPWRWLRKGAIPLSVTPKGKPVAEIDSVDPPDDTLLLHPVHVLGTESGHTRVAIATYGGTLFGWVPSSLLWTSSRQYVDLSHDCDYVLALPPREGNAFVACDHDVPLVAQVGGGEMRQVGTVRAGAAFERVRASAGWTEVAFRSAGIAAASGAAFLVRDADVVSCTPAP